MFEIKCVVKSSKLADVLVRLDGLTLEPPMVTPLHKSEPARAAKTKNRFGTVAEQLGSWIKDNNIKTFSGSDARAATGGDKQYYNGIKKLISGGLVKKGKGYSNYEVVR